LGSPSFLKNQLLCRIIKAKAMSYCNNLFNYQRAQTVQVAIGNQPLGGSSPIRVQSMTTTNTLDTEATVEQCIRIFDAGADYVRITAQGIQEAENLKNIRKRFNSAATICH